MPGPGADRGVGVAGDVRRTTSRTDMAPTADSSRSRSSAACRPGTSSSQDRPGRDSTSTRPAGSGPTAALGGAAASEDTDHEQAQRHRPPTAHGAGLGVIGALGGTAPMSRSPAPYPASARPPRARDGEQRGPPPSGAQASMPSHARPPATTAIATGRSWARCHGEPASPRRRTASATAPRRRRRSGRDRPARACRAVGRRRTPRASQPPRATADDQRRHRRRAAVAQGVGHPGQEEEAPVHGDADGQAHERGAEQLGPSPSEASPKASTAITGADSAVSTAAIGIVAATMASPAQRTDARRLARRRRWPGLGRQAGAGPRCGSAARRSRTAPGTPPWRAGRPRPRRPPRHRRSRRRRGGCRCRRAAARPSSSGREARDLGSRQAPGRAEGGSPIVGARRRARRRTPRPRGCRPARGSPAPWCRGRARVGARHLPEHEHRDHQDDRVADRSDGGSANRFRAWSTAVVTAPRA